MTAKKSAAPVKKAAARPAEQEGPKPPTAAQLRAAQLERRRAAGRCESCGLRRPYADQVDCIDCLVGRTIPTVDEPDGDHAD